MTGHTNMDTKQELSQSITLHVMRILDLQDQIKSCDQSIKDLADQHADACKHRKDLETQLIELNDVLQYSLFTSSDPTQALLTMSHKEVQKAVARTKKPQKNGVSQRDYVQAMLSHKISQDDWLDKYTNHTTW